MTADGKIEVMVASSVYGYEDQRNQICGLFDNGIREGITAGITEGVTASKVQIASMILVEGSCMAAKIAIKIKRPYKTLERHLCISKQIGAIEYIGYKTAGGYEVTE